MVLRVRAECNGHHCTTVYDCIVSGEYYNVQTMAYYYSPFRKVYAKPSEGCPFCTSATFAEQIITSGHGMAVENEHYRWIINAYPKFEGHTMVVPKRHVTTLGDESAEEIVAREELIVLASNTLRKLYPGSGIEVFIQTGEGSESSVAHLHWHVVPSLPEDHLRGFDKLGHFFTIEQDKEKVIVFPVPIRLAQSDLLNALRDVLRSRS